jgi:hypothetical protein
MGRRAAWIGLLALGAALVGVAWKGRELQSEPGVRTFRSAPSELRSAPRTTTTPSRRRLVHEALDYTLGDAGAKGGASASASALASAAPLIVASAAPVSAASAAQVAPATAVAAATEPSEIEHEPEPRAENTSLRAPELRVWTQAGLCSNNVSDSEQVRRRLRERFRTWDGGELGRLFLDPRLPDSARKAVSEQLTQSQEAVRAVLRLDPDWPEVFVYADAELLRASACVNGEVVAFYDGALHVVRNDEDLAASITHELAHHALMSAGVRGPAWAQEGIAMHAANERWWRERARLARLKVAGLGLESMEDSIPYKLSTDQALMFYVEAAAMVQCVLVRKRWALHELVTALQGSLDAIADVRELTNPALLEGCALER